MTPEIKKMMEEILNSVKSLEARMDRLEVGGVQITTTSAHSVPAERRQSIKEFLIECAPSGGVQTNLAIAYYLEIVQGVIPFNKDDLENGYRAAKETVPENINDKVNMSIANGHLMEAEAKKDSKKAWVVTRSGEQYVQGKFKKK
jgi:hypothetical protein